MAAGIGGRANPIGWRLGRGPFVDEAARAGEGEAGQAAVGAVEGGRVAWAVGAIGGQVVDPVDVGQPDPGPRPAEFQVDLYVEALEVEQDSQGVGGPVVGVGAPADRAPAAAVGLVQPGAEDPLELAGGGRV